MQKKSNVYLASASPRRLELLSQIGIKATTLIPNISEKQEIQELPLNYAIRLAMNKAKAGWLHPERILDLPVIGADTIVILDNHILGKPKNKDNAIGMLKQLSGRTHQVITAVAMADQHQMLHDYAISEVTFSELTEEQIDIYWQTGESCDKAGAYAIQGKAAVFISHLQGSYSAVMGLPLFETAKLLGSFGIRV